MSDELANYEIIFPTDLLPFVIAHGPHSVGMGGFYLRLRFENGYGASVVRTPWSYGGTEGLFELAVLIFSEATNDKFGLCYSTPITDDVLGYLSHNEVVKTLYEIKALPFINGDRIIEANAEV